jgi:hypothetical protein
MNSWLDIRAQLGSGVQRASLIVILALFGAVMRPGGYQPEPQAPIRDPMQLIASPNDPLMIKAISYAKARRAEDGPWGKDDHSEGPTATFKTPGGSITLTRDQIASANYIYPQLTNQAQGAADRAARQTSPDAGFDSEFDDHSQWGN